MIFIGNFKYCISVTSWIRLSFFALLFSALVPASVIADDFDKLAIDVSFEHTDGLTVASWSITNTGDKPIRPGKIVANYACGDGYVERVEHIFRYTIAPKATLKEEGSFVCAGRQEAVSFFISGPPDTNMSIQRSGNEILYQMTCGDGVKVFVTLRWNNKGYYTFEAPNNVTGIVSDKVLEDGEFIRKVCGPIPLPPSKVIEKMKKWFIEDILTTKGDPKKGYSKSRGGGFAVRG